MSSEMAPVEAGAMGTLFGSIDNPELAMGRMKRCAKVLADVVEAQKMYTLIGQGKHLRVEAWQTLGGMVGVYGVCAWTRKLENGWEARVEARTKSGELVGAAEAECLSTEKNWSTDPHTNRYGKEVDGKEDHHLRSMAQTRALSKALSMPLRFIVALAGYQGTPAEEMPASEAVFKSDRKVNQPSEKAAPAAAGEEWTGTILKVMVKEYDKKDKVTKKPTGEKGKIYTITSANTQQEERTFKTFSETFATEAKFAMANAEHPAHPVTIKFTASVYDGQTEYKIDELTAAETNEGTDA